MIPQFDANGLLPSGIHTCSWQEIEDFFCWNGKRKIIFSGMKRFLAEQFYPMGFVCPILVDGSFARSKTLPDDIDIVLDLSDLCYRQQATITPKAKDRYGRTVGDVECQGRDAGAEQVRTGFAWVYDRYARGYDALYPRQDAAKAARLGLWADPAPEKPWEWRSAGR